MTHTLEDMKSSSYIQIFYNIMLCLIKLISPLAQHYVANLKISVKLTEEIPSTSTCVSVDTFYLTSMMDDDGAGFT